MVTKPYKIIWFGAMDGPKPYKFIGFGDIHGPKPYKFIGFGDTPWRCGRLVFQTALNGLTRNPINMVEREAPHNFGWVARPLGAV